MSCESTQQVAGVENTLNSCVESTQVIETQRGNTLFLNELLTTS